MTADSVMHEVYVVSPQNLEAAIEAARNHVHSAICALLAVADSFKEIQRRAKTDHPLRCICVDCEIRFSNEHWPFAFGIVLPMFPNTSRLMVAHGICVECFARDDFDDAVLAALQQIFPKSSFNKVDRLQ